MFAGIYKNRRVLVTGHTGFKGSWLCKWLNQLGAEVYGYSLLPKTKPNHFNLSNPNVTSQINDIKDINSVRNFITKSEPEIIFHLAAQPSVLESYENPIDTFATNVLGTSNILEAAKITPSVKAVIIVTTDKCYKNKEWSYGYRENDELGGHDPYSASKACCELIAESYKKSFFEKEKEGILIATARAGNVLGGGDWTSDRIITDIVMAVSKKQKLILRNPESIRPWQHVLEPLSGYLLLGQLLFQNKKEFAKPWNFGPSLSSNIKVLELVDLANLYWNEIEVEYKSSKNHETKHLILDSSRAYNNLNWQPIWEIDLTIKNTVEWYKSYYEKRKIITDDQIINFTKDALNKNLFWTKDLEEGKKLKINSQINQISKKNKSKNIFCMKEINNKKIIKSHSNFKKLVDHRFNYNRALSQDVN